ncbi:hypothetical protein A176_004458 [Myxococcus hansupus]|uniref:Uncharacterized protein n=1 Tax=Pseudomyxococcus hansupus TaxID=1297742 RepID=A0A0H4WVY1_9BACT|nr:hypothetical protein A176_004458 [Myxococcus hansupus]
MHAASSRTSSGRRPNRSTADLHPAPAWRRRRRSKPPRHRRLPRQGAATS